MNVEPHRMNMRLYGAWYTLDDGRGVYLAYRKPSQVYRKKTAWCIDRTTLDATVDRGIKYAGVAVRNRGKVEYYMTLVSDFFGPFSFVNFDNPLQRGLPLSRFKITPATLAANVERAIRLRR